MKKLLLISILFVLALSSFAQDLIITDKGDSINCRISKIKTDNIYFTFKYEDEYRNTLLPLSRLKYHQIDYFQVSEVPEDKVVGFENYPHVRVAIDGGYSYLTAKLADNIPSGLVDFYKELKSGYHYGGEISYYFTEPLGFGFRIYMFNTSNSIVNSIYGNMSQEIAVSFIGPSFSTRLMSHNKRNAFLMNMSFGYMGYTNDLMGIDDYQLTGNTLGLAFDFGYDIGISENMVLGFKLSLVRGTLFEYEIHDGSNVTTIELEEGEYEGLGRIDFSIGLRFTR